MTKVEIAIIVIACLIPIIALVLLLPKRLKKVKKSAPTKVADTPTSPQQIEPVQETKPAEKEVEFDYSNINNSSISKEDLKGYLTEKASKIPRPKRKEREFDGEFDDDIFGRHFDDRFGQREEKRDKTISEQIQDLPPDVKILLLAGVLDKIDY